MDLSVVVPTLNGRTQLRACLDALAAEVPESEVIVVNGPSVDGTTGMVSDRADVDVLVEVADRNINVSRNAGIEHATGERVAFVSHDCAVEEGWADALAAGFATLGDDARAPNHRLAEGLGAAAERVGAVTGPIRRRLTGGVSAESPESRTIAGRDVRYFNGGNVAFARAALDRADGFDEYLPTGGARDLAHRLAAGAHAVAWSDAMCARSEFGADGGTRERDWGWKYRSLAYRLGKNYGLRPTAVRRLLSHAGRDALDSLRGVARGDATPSSWAGTGRDVVAGMVRGDVAGVAARWRDRGRHNPNGLSSREDRAVEVYDWR